MQAMVTKPAERQQAVADERSQPLPPDVPILMYSADHLLQGGCTALMLASADW